MSDSLWPHESQHTRPPCPSPTPRVYSNSCPSSWWCHTAISSSVVPFSSFPQSPPASWSFQWVYSLHEVAKVLELWRHFHYRGLECKSMKSRNTWSNRQIWPWSTEGSRAKANRVLPREHTGHSKHAFPTTQGKTLHMDITRWSTLKSDWLYSLQSKMEKLYTVSKNKTGGWLWLRSWTPYCQIQA